jgi:hypothetical protein
MRYDANDDYALFNLADMALPKGDHCGWLHGVLQFSSSYKNSRPEN